jgi:hypothetical protein
MLPGMGRFSFIKRCKQVGSQDCSSSRVRDSPDPAWEKALRQIAASVDDGAIAGYMAERYISGMKD